MVEYKITGDTNGIKGKIKYSHPKNHSWQYNFEKKEWVLEIPSDMATKKFEDSLKKLCDGRNCLLKKSFYKPKNHYDSSHQVKMRDYIFENGNLNEVAFFEDLYKHSEH